MWIGSSRDSTATPLGLTWHGSDKAVGIVFTYNTTVQLQTNSYDKLKDTWIYIIIQVILAFWLVLVYDLLEDRCTIDVTSKFLPLCFKMAESFENLDNSPGARDRLWRSRLLGKLANFNLARIISWTLVVNAGVAVETLQWAVCGGRVWKLPYMYESISNVNVWARVTLHHEL